ncbi:uncharacterized protein H6S33_007729 [Morchella sextelata]|uniref:uncharacterized protein n=1 Tax=Morchella sextelata TaxID=1174677 RepID=UPI001D047C06|nr:uncharacterized protein H6S33_007729 [Morchella sextelata]KAH0603407.1 hypothetical protein H6S33_007729 [Morchella sextelata]
MSTSSTKAALQTAIKTSVRRILHFTGPHSKLKDIFDDVSDDILHFVRFPTTRGQVSNTFYQLLDSGGIPHLERDRRSRRLASRRRGRRRSRGSGRRSGSLASIPPPPPPPPLLLLPPPPPGPPPRPHSHSTCSSTASHPDTTIPLSEQRALLSALHRACLYACFTFCKHTLRLDITRNIDDPVASQVCLSALVEAIIAAYNSGTLAPELIDEEAGFGPGNAFERAGCVEDAVVWRGPMGDRRLLSVLQAGEEIVAALRDGERVVRVDALYRRAERLIGEAAGAGAEAKAKGEEWVEETTDDEDR